MACCGPSIIEKKWMLFCREFGGDSEMSARLPAAPPGRQQGNVNPQNLACMPRRLLTGCKRSRMEWAHWRLSGKVPTATCTNAMT
mmetsp:Transcript_51058/g.122200  ORF Transcript_51058/g.122200 Transcript_51058/m.122200 type:complete len:85 (+) Transcript_51058:1471-1725(+)